MAGTDVLALIPARVGSKGIPGKNFRSIAGRRSPVERALDCALGAGISHMVISSDCDGGAFCWQNEADAFVEQLYRPPALAQDDTPMVDVVKHALAVIDGPNDQIILLVQPTQPLREPKHLTAAVALLRASQTQSVVSVAELYPAGWVLRIDESGFLEPLDSYATWFDRPPCRQGAEAAYRADGTVIAFWRRTLLETGTIYGGDVTPLVIPPEETCPLDTMADWAEAERRLREREG